MQCKDWNKDYYTIINFGLGVKDIIKITIYPESDNQKWVPALCHTPNDFLLTYREQLLVNRKYLFDTLKEAINYVEGEL